MKKLTLYIVCILLSINVIGQEWVLIDSHVPAGPTTTVLSATDGVISLRFTLGGYYATMVSTPRGVASVISVSEMASMLEAGNPDLPLYAIPVAIGDKDAMEVEVTKARYVEFAGVDVAPSKGNLNRNIDPAMVPYRYGEVYSYDAFYPAQQAILDRPYVLRDLRGQNILVYPFAYNPVSRVLRVYIDLTLNLHRTDAQPVNPKTNRKAVVRCSTATEAMYARRFVNYSMAVAKYPFVTDEGSTIVLCPAQYCEAMQPYVDWKNQSGRPTTLYTLDEAGGNNSANLKEFISSHYDNTDENLCYVLLVGDYADLTPPVMNGGCSDIWFGQLEGSDYYPEVFVGRFSVGSVADVEHQVAKVIYYERDMPAEADWIGKGMGIGSTEGAGSGHYGESDYQHIDYIRDTLLHYTYSEVSQHYAGVGMGTNASMLSANFNEGVGICNYCNHGFTTGWYVGSFTNSHIDALTNDYRWPFIWSTACLNGKFDVDCFAEVWMRATDDVTGVPTGAIGGMFSWTSQAWQPPMTGQDEMVDILTEWRSADRYHHTLAGASLNGNMKILDLHPSDQGDTHNTWILFGDPNLMLRTSTPEPMDIVCQPEVIFLGQTELHLIADVDYALATLTLDGNVLCSTPVINGEATLTFESPTETGTALLVVTAFNKVTYVKEVDIIPANGAYLAFDSYSINSENGQADYGKTFSIDVTVKNVGNEIASDVQVRLLSNSPYVEILDGEAIIPAITPMEQYTIVEDFQIKVVDMIEDGTQAELILDCYEGDFAWASNFLITLHAPVLTLSDFCSTANVGPGDSGTLMVGIHNMGSAAAHNARVELFSSSTEITFDQTVQYLWTIPAGETATAYFHFTTAPEIAFGSSYEMMYVAEADQYMIDGTEFLNIGVMKETFETGDFSMFDWQTLGGAYWHVDSSTANTGIYSARSGTIGHSNLTTLQINIDVTADGQLSFYKKLSTEADKDLLTFYIDGQTMNVWSGEVDWSLERYDMTAGTHSLRWIYYKNGSGSYGDDACWLDDIQFPAAVVVELLAGPELQATVDHNRVTLMWESVGVDYEYIVRCDGAYLTTQSATSYTEVRGDGTYLYSVTAKHQEHLSAPSYLLVEVGILGMDETGSDISVFPNPTQGIMFVEAQHITSPQAEYRVFNLTGQQILSGTVSETLRIDLIGQPKGVYVLQIVDDGQVITKKIVLQ